MGHQLEIHHMGPIDSCVLDIDHFTVLTGPQSNGKSTVAKAIYFFRSIKQDILNIMMQGGPKVSLGRENVSWMYVLKQRMRDKFLQLFGPSWIMPDNMEMKYTYASNMLIRVFLKPDIASLEKNQIEFELSDCFQDYLTELDTHSFADISIREKKYEEAQLSQKLSDPYETVFIPAGRNLITLLSTQLNYIFTSLESTQLRNIDYITKRYTELILKLKPSFENGLAGLIRDMENNPEQMKGYVKHKPAINLLIDSIQKVLKGNYRYVDGEERLYIDEKKYIKINFASSGQQETVWVFNLLFYYMIEDRKVLLILEEPESHLYPESQQTMAEILALFLNEGNAELITTHSPYILGTFNYLLLAAQSNNGAEMIKKKLDKQYWIDPNIASAYYIHDGVMDHALDTADDLILIDNGLIDGASEEINEMNGFIIDQIGDWGTGDE